MIIECPSCASTFNLDDALVPPSGRKVRCSVCDNVFDVRPKGKAAPAPAPEPDLSAPDDDLELGDDFGADDDDLLSSLGDALDEDEAPAPRGAKAQAADDLEAEDDADGDSGGLSLDFGAATSKKKKAKGGKGGKGKLIGIVAAVLVLLLGAGGAGVWFFAPGLLGLGADADKPASPEAEAMAMAEQVKKISLESIKQYYVDNDKAGRLFVIQGKAVNLFETPKELIEIEAGLYDAQNKELAVRRLKCGNSIDLFQLQTLSETEIDEALNNEAGIGANNVNIQPGGSTPFMVVFFNPPDSLAEFNVKVVAAHNVDL